MIHEFTGRETGKNMAKLTIEVSADDLEKHFRVRITDRNPRSASRDSGKEKYRARW